jgi:hypothetical protein
MSVYTIIGISGPLLNKIDVVSISLICIVDVLLSFGGY